MTPHGPLRWVRGGWTGLTCGVGGLVAHHHAMSGHAAAPGVGVQVLVVLISLTACALLTARRLGPLGLGAVTVAMQGVVHLLLAGAAPAGAHAVHGAHEMTGATGAHGGADMLVAHLLVAVLTTCVAAGGEQALITTARRLAARLCRLPVRPHVSLGEGRLRPVGPGTVLVRRVLVAGVRTVRGPPAGRLAPPSPA